MLGRAGLSGHSQIGHAFGISNGGVFVRFKALTRRAKGLDQKVFCFGVEFL